MSFDDVILQSTIARTMADGICVIKESDHTIIYANPKFEAMFGYDSGELEGKPVSIVNHETYAGEASQITARIIREVTTHGEYTCEVWNQKKNGTLFWCRATNSALSHPKYGNVIIAVQHDITEKKITELALQESEEKYRALVEGSYDPILVTDKNGIITYTNPQLDKTFGYEKFELIGQSVEVLIPKRFHKTHVTNRQTYAKKPEQGPMGDKRELFALTKDGREFATEISLSPSHVHGTQQTTAVIRDVSERKAYESRMEFLSHISKLLSETRDYEERIRLASETIVGHLADACLVAALEEGQCQFKVATSSNRASLQKFNEIGERVTSDEGPSSIRSVLRTGEPVLVEDVEAEMKLPGHIVGDRRNNLKALSIKSYCFLPLNVNGKTIGVLSLAMIDSGRKLSKEDLPFLNEVANRFATKIENARLYFLQQQAIAARQHILTMVSHDLKNPIMVVDLIAQTMKNNDYTMSQSKEFGTRLCHASKFMERLVSDLLDLDNIESKTFTLLKSDHDPKEILDLTAEGIEQKLNTKNQVLKLNFDPHLPRLTCDKDRVLQVLWNLLGNAIKFTPKGGTIYLGLDEMNGFAHFSVKDSGPGIQKTDQPKIFERYWQAKETAHLGSGLGLTIAKEIVEAHGGRIWLESVLNEGATFHFALPLAKIDSTPPLTKSLRDEAQLNASILGKKILIVDDSEDNRFILRHVLLKTGAIVIEARSVSEAVMKLYEHVPDLLITDIEMPDGDGFSLGKRP
jgi:PAS domain S-box-containing protein